MPSVAFPAPKVRALVKDELRQTFERVAARGSMRLGLPKGAMEELARTARAAETVAIPAPEREALRTAAAPPPAPAPVSVPKTAAVRTTAPAPTPAPSTVFRRAVSLGAMEDDMRTSHYQMGQLTIPRELLKRTAVAAPLTTLQPRTPTTQSYVGGYPVVREEDKPNYTTWIMVGALGLVVVGGVYYAKKKRMF